MRNTSGPIVGINLDHETALTFSDYPWYALRDNYFSAPALHGGVPIALPYCIEHIDTYLNLVDGLIIPGGRFDVPPHYYDADHVHETTKVNPHRTTFEIELCKRALSKDIPILGICGGMQLLNVVQGGSLIQSIVHEIDGALNHFQEKNRHQTVHSIHIQQGTLLYDIAQSAMDHPVTEQLGHKQLTSKQLIPKQTIEGHVNSSHRQAIKRIASTARVGATAPDHIIEAIEFPDHRFCLGVQWHPEFLMTPLDHGIFKAFIEACTPRE